MHPVIRHLKSRKNKAMPFCDRRKIALVNFGGFMSGVRNAGAMVALLEMGYGKSFDSIYTISSGFFNALSFLSGDGQKNISVYYENLISKNFFNPLRLYKLIDSDYLVNILNKAKKVNIENILEQKTELFLRVRNLGKNRDEYLEVHKFKKPSFKKLFKLAASAPYLSPGYVRLRLNNYKDPQMTELQTIEHVNYVLNSKATDILILYNEKSQYLYAKKHVPAINSDRIFNIYPLQSSILDRVETSPKKLMVSAASMGRLCKKAFGLRSSIKLYKSPDKK